MSTPDRDGEVSRPRVAGLILAGGMSRRLGRPKQTLPYGDGTLLEHTIRQAEAVPELDPIVAVLPPNETLVPDPAVYRARVVRRPEGTDCSSSLRAGLQTLPQTMAVAVLPADQPKLTGELLSLAVHSWLQTRPLALTLIYHGRTGHPFIFSSALLHRLRDLEGDKAMWRLLEDLGDEVKSIEVDLPLPADVDTWADYERLLVVRAP